MRPVKREVLVTADVVIVTSSVSGSMKIKKDIASLKNMLASKNAPYVEIDASIDAEKRDELRKISGVTTLPQCFINGEYIGDFDKVQELEEQEKLDELLETKPTASE